MSSRSPSAVALVPALVVALLLGLAGAPLFAFHFPWDQGHDTFTPDPGPDDTDPDDQDCNSSGSPFEVASGNFFHKVEDFAILGLGPAIEILRIYNSRDLRSGPIGHGWTFSLDQRLIETTDGVSSFAICRQGSGKRERYLRNPDGSFSGPSDLSATLDKLPDGTFRLTAKDGTVHRFDVDGRLVSREDRYGNALTVSYDATGFPELLTDAAGRSVQLVKGPNGKISSIQDPAGRIFRYDHDPEGNLTGFTDPIGNRTEYVYDSDHNLIQIIDPRGNVQQEVTYDSRGRVATFTEQGEIWTVSYFPGRTTKRDSSGRTWEFLFNDNGNITQRIDPLGASESFGYDAGFRISSRVDRNGNQTTFTYDDLGNLLSTTDALGNVNATTYEPDFSQPTAVTDALGNVTTFEYDGQGNLLRTIDPLGNVSSFAYDAKGQVVAMTDPLGNVTTFTNSATGRLETITDPLGNVTRLEYDVLGNVTAMIDALGRKTLFEYDPNAVLNRPLRIVDPAGGVTEYTYDASGNVTSIEDPNGHVTTFEYDSLNRLSRTVDPLGLEKSLTFDSRGNMISVTDAKGQTIDLAYDDLDRLVREETPDNTTLFTYDAAGNVLSVVDDDSSLTFTYDALDRLIRVDTGATAGQPATTVSYTYDGNGNRLSMTRPDGGVTLYSYDSLGRLTLQTNPEGETTTYSYDAISRIGRVDLANGSSATYGYNAAGEIVALANDIGGLVSSLSYDYDAFGNRVSFDEPDGSNTYAYDATNRLLASTHPQSTNPAETFAYDLAGNRVSSHLSSSYTYDAANRLLEDDTFTYAHDANGNLTSKSVKASGETTGYRYDAKNQLVGIDLPDGTVVDYRYDGMGRRIEKNVGGSIVRYVYDNEDILTEFDGFNSIVANYTHGPGTDEPISMSRGGASFFYHRDSIGTIRELSDAVGAVVATYVYDSFGQVVDGSGAVESPYGFTGRELDPESGLLFHRARYYDPSIGRFLQQDPAGFEGGLNFYAYSLNDPINHIDPFGLYGTRDCTYYDKQCEEYNGDYYCNWAPKWCKRFNRWDAFHWTRCVRKCLQDYDKKNCSPSEPCTDPEVEKQVLECNKKGHVFCYLKCLDAPGVDPNTGQSNPNTAPAVAAYEKRLAGRP